MFADLVGFTTFAEGRDAEDVRDTLSRYFDLASELIGRYGGRVEKFIGDAVMALWGAPVAFEDDAERAVRAALELVDAIKTLGPGIAARAGVLTGEAAVTLGATNQGMVAGDLVNTAARLQSVASPGTVLVGEATERAASRAIVFEEAGEHIVKGKTAPVGAWRAVRVVAEVGGRNRATGIEAPFVGRDEELRQIKDHFHATGRDRRARLVSVIGPAGIGKSRLAWEFSKYIDGLVERVWWHDGRSPAYGEGITFWALGEMIRGRASLLETDDEATTRAKVVAMIEEHVPDPSERSWIEQALLALLGVETGIPPQQLFGAWRTFFERLALTGTVVLVFEDLHFADPGLVDFVDHLLEWSRGVPIFVVTLARPELVEKHPDWGAGKRSFVSVHLDPLSEDAMYELLDGLVPGLPQQAAAAIVARADGIPLYAVEIVRMLLASGQLTAAAGAYEPMRDVSVAAIPETLTALIASRLDTLAPAERSLVADAAVLGQSFTIAALASVSGRPGPDLEAHLRALVRREFLTLQADPRSPELGQYMFVQALIREVAYNTLAKRDRKSRHLAAARFFEGLGTDELASVLAGHFLAAYQSSGSGPDSDALRAQARIALEAAALRAAGLGAPEQASSFLAQALTITTERAARGLLLERAAAVSNEAASHGQAEDLARQAIDLWRDLGDRGGVARATALLGRSMLDAYRSTKVIGILSGALSELSDLEGDPSLTELRGQLARAYFLAGDSRKAVEIADLVLEAAERSDLGALLADTLVTKGSALGDLRRVVEGTGTIRIGGALAATLGMSGTAIRASVNAALFDLSRDPRAALETSRDGIAASRRLGSRSLLTSLLNNGALAALRTGDWSWAIGELESALADTYGPENRADLLEVSIHFDALRGLSTKEALIELDASVGNSSDPWMRTTLQSTRGFIAFASGDPGAAAPFWREAIGGHPASLPEWMPRVARAELWAGSREAAEEALTALDTGGHHGAAMTADRTTIRAGLAALDGRPADAINNYREALRAWRQLGLRWDEALCGIDMAMFIGPSHPEVKAAAESARAILIDLEAAPFVERLDSILAVPAGATPLEEASASELGVRIGR